MQVRVKKREELGGRCPVIQKAEPVQERVKKRENIDRGGGGEGDCQVVQKAGWACACAGKG